MFEMKTARITEADKTQMQAVFDSMYAKIRGNTDEGGDPYTTLRRIRADRYAATVRSCWRFDAEGKPCEIEDSEVVRRAKMRLRSEGRDGKKLDVDAIAFARELEFLSATLHAISIPALTSFDVLPLAPDQPVSGSTSHSWPELSGAIFEPARSYDSEPPMPSFTRQKYSNVITPYTGAYGWDEGQMQSALLANVPLPTLTAWYTLYSLNRRINLDNYFGDTSRGINGYFTATGVTSADVPNGAAGTKAWSTKTAAEIYADIQAAYTAFMAAVQGGLVTTPIASPTLTPDFIFLPPKQYAQIAAEPYSTLNPMSIKEVAEKNMGIKFVQIPELSQAFPVASPTKDAMAISKIDPMLAGRIVAKPFTEKPPQFRDFNVRVPCAIEAGGVENYKPVALQIYTAI